MTSTETLSLYDLDRQFSGRNEAGFPGGYEPTALYLLHPRQRAEVWKREHQLKLLESFDRGRYVPPIIVHEVIENNIRRRYILDGGNRFSAVRRILRGTVRELTADELLRVRSYTIMVVVLRGLDAAEIREQFRLLNRVVRVTDGHLYYMSREDSPLIDYACRLMEDPEHPLRAQIVALFGEAVLQDTDSRGTLSNLMALCAGAQHGLGPRTASGKYPQCHITRSFDVNCDILGVPVDAALIETRLRICFAAFERADDIIRMADARVRKGEFNVGRYLGVMLHDLAVGIDPMVLVGKWSQTIASVRDGNGTMANATTIKGAQNLNHRKMSQISFQVDFALGHQRMPNEAELHEWRARTGDDATVAEEDEDEDN
jgi:hypothetical protein